MLTTWLFVAPVVMEDLSLAPRYCLWQHAQGDEPVTLTFDDVPLGDELEPPNSFGLRDRKPLGRGGPDLSCISVDAAYLPLTSLFGCLLV